MATDDPANMVNLLTDVARESMKMLKKVVCYTRRPRRAKTLHFPTKAAGEERPEGILGVR